MASSCLSALEERQFFELWFLGVGWLAVVVCASVAYWLRRGKYIFRPRFVDPLFLERWRSGRSLRSLLTSLGGASRCLWIAITNDELAVGPDFPFSLMFLPEIYGLEHRISGNDILSAQQIRTSFFGGRVLVRFRRPDGNVEGFEISVNNVQGFLRAVEILRGKSAAAAG
jgi:hypothetical protein